MVKAPTSINEPDGLLKLVAPIVLPFEVIVWLAVPDKIEPNPVAVIPVDNNTSPKTPILELVQDPAYPVKFNLFTH